MLFRLRKHFLHDLAVSKFVHIFGKPIQKELELLKVYLPVLIRIEKRKRLFQCGFIKASVDLSLQKIDHSFYPAEAFIFRVELGSDFISAWRLI